MKKEALLIIFVFVLIFINGCENYPYFTSKSINVIEIPNVSKTNETNISLPNEDIAYPTEDVSIPTEIESLPETETPSVEELEEVESEIIIKEEKESILEEQKIIEEDKRVTYLKRIFEFPKIDLTEKLKTSFQIIIPNKIKELFSDIKYDFDIKLPFFKLKEYKNEIFKNKFIKDKYNIINKENIFIPDLNLRVKDYLIIDNVRLPLYKGNLGGILIRKETKLDEKHGKIIYGFKNKDIKNKDIQFLWEIEIPLEYNKINNFDLDKEFTDSSIKYNLYGDKAYYILFNDVKSNFGEIYSSYDPKTRIVTVYSKTKTIEKDEEIILDPEWGENLNLSFVSWVGYHTPEYVDVDETSNYLYVGTNAFVIEDITDKSNPIEISHLRPLEYGFPRSTVAYGDYAYTFWSGKGVRVIDISDKTDPEIVSTNFDPDYGYKLLYIQYPYLYASVEKKDIDYHQLYIIDISDPTNLVLHGSYDLSGFVSTQGLEFTDAVFDVFDGDYAYIIIGHITGNGVFTDGAQLLVLNIADPSNPSLVGGPLVLGDFDTGQNEYYRRYLRLDKKDNYLFIIGYFANPEAGMKIVDVSNPSNPVIVNNAWIIPTQHPGNVIPISDIDIEGNYAYVTGHLNNKMYVLDLSNSLNPQEVASISLPLPWYYNKIFDIKVKGNYAYLHMWDNYAIYLVDVSAPTNPQLSSIIPFGHDHSDVSAPPGDYVFMSVWDYLQFYTVDMSTQQLPLVTNREEVMGGGFGLEVKENYAYLAMGPTCSSLIVVPCGGLHIYDITNPSNPVFVGNSSQTNGGGDVQVYVDTSEMKAYVVDGETFNEDINFPPIFQSQTPGLRIVDVSDPSNPVELGRYNLPAGEGMGLSVYKFGNYAYLTGKQGGLYIIDVSDSANPTLAAQWVDFSGPTRPHARGVFVKDNYVYLAYGKSLRILDVSTPTNPTEVANYPFDEEAKDVAVDGNYAYVITINALVALDITDPTNPFEVASQVDVFSLHPGRIDVKGEYIYVVGHNMGLYTFRLVAGGGGGEICSDGTPLGECSTRQPLMCVIGHQGQIELLPRCEECGCPQSASYCTYSSYSYQGAGVPVGYCFEQDFNETLETNPLLTCRLNSPLKTGSLNTTGGNFEVNGADLGVTVLHNNKIFYFFGDGGSSNGNDPYANSSSNFCPDLDWYLDSNNLASSMIDWSIPEPGSHVPSGGISLNGNIYVYIMRNNWGGPTTEDSYLVKSVDNGLTFEKVTGVEWGTNNKFLNIAPVAGQLNGQNVVFFLATGNYGISPLYLGYTSNIEDISAYRYFTGLVNNEPTWSTSPDDAVPVTNDITNGRELGLQFNEYLQKYIIIVTSDGIKYGSAENLWGPWSIQALPGLDSLSAFRIYGGYIVPQMTQGSNLYVVISLWWPYTSYIMNFNLDVLEGIAGLETCENLNGYICEENQYCSGTLIQASNTNNCCSVPCSETSLCSECGGLFGFGCSRDECYNIPEGCYFIYNFVWPNDCNSCLNADCESYNDDQQTCSDDPCNLGNCQWNTNTGQCETLPLPECINGQTQNCPLQQGVCLGFLETCTNNIWPGCTASNYGASYQVSETTCIDNLDNDCDGLIDSNDPDCLPCNTGQTQLCPNQNGVCAGSSQTCTNNQWPGCSSLSYGANYQIAESACTDDLDNDCDSYVDCDDANCNANPACIQPGPGGSGGGGGGGGSSSSSQSPIITPPIVISGSNETGLYQIESPLSLYTIDFSNQDILEIELEKKGYILKIDNYNYTLVVNEINENNVNLQIDSNEIDLIYNTKGAFNLVNNKILYISLLNINNDKANIRFEVSSELPLVEEKPRRTIIGDLVTESSIIISSIIISVILIVLIIFYLVKIRSIKKKKYNKEEVMKVIKDALAKGYSEEQIKVRFMRNGWDEKEIDKLLKKVS